MIKTEERDGVLTNVVSADMTPDDVIAYVNEHVEEWQRREICWILDDFDFSSINSTTVQTFIARLARRDSPRAGLKIALVVGDDFGFGMLRMLEMMAEGQIAMDINVLRTFEEAARWIKNG